MVVTALVLAGLKRTTAVNALLVTVTVGALVAFAVAGLTQTAYRHQSTAARFVLGSSPPSRSFSSRTPGTDGSPPSARKFAILRSPFPKRCC